MQCVWSNYVTESMGSAIIDPLLGTSQFLACELLLVYMTWSAPFEILYGFSRQCLLGSLVTESMDCNSHICDLKPEFLLWPLTMLGLT